MKIQIDEQAAQNAKYIKVIFPDGKTIELWDRGTDVDIRFGDPDFDVGLKNNEENEPAGV